MKKALCILLAILMLTGLLSGCASEPKPLLICVDLEYTQNYGDSYGPINEAVEDFLDRLAQAGGPTDIEVEYIPGDGSERSAALDRVRTEIMSGRGPDVFIMNCDAKDAFHKNEALFTIPKKMYELGVFLPLDEYMENNTEFAEWDQMNSVILKTGRGDEGQQIIPLAYTLPISVYRQEEVTHEPSKDISWYDMLETDDSALLAATVWTDATGDYREGCPFLLNRDALPEYILGDLVDFEDAELLFSAEELMKCFDEIYALAQKYRMGEFQNVPPHYNEFLGWEMNVGNTLRDSTGAKYDTKNGIGENESVTMVPLYSVDGGVTATITGYTAINRNTKRPEDAYKVVDFLLSKEIQSTTRLYRFILGNRTCNMPMHNSITSREDSIYLPNKAFPDKRGLEWFFDEDNFEAMSKVRDQITHARFRDEIDNQLAAAWLDYLNAKWSGTDPKESIELRYRTMQRILRE